MASRLRLCRATQSARASASATVIIASTSTASYSPKINVDVIGSKPSASPKGFGRSPTIAFPGAVKTFKLSVFDATGVVMCVVSFGPFCGLSPSRCQSVHGCDQNASVHLRELRFFLLVKVTAAIEPEETWPRNRRWYRTRPACGLDLRERIGRYFLPLGSQCQRISQ